MRDEVLCKLRGFMKKQNLSCTLMEYLSEVPADTIRDYLYKQRIPGLINALKLSRAMGITLDELVGRAKCNTKQNE